MTLAGSTPVILASGSAIRAQLLRAAGLEISVVRPRVDEEAAKASLRAAGASVRDQADALAELKALSVSRNASGLVIGADQILSLDGVAFDKPADRAEAAAQLQALSGRSHSLVTAVVGAREGTAIWRHVATPRLTMRALGEDFVRRYLDAMGDRALESVGGYQLEGLGAQLFSQIEGDYFSILGLPLLPLLDFLRLHGGAPA